MFAALASLRPFTQVKVLPSVDAKRRGTRFAEDDGAKGRFPAPFGKL